MPKISVIIPCYNVEKWIDRCLESVINQSIGMSDLEVICVDDCSTDGTLSRLYEWENKYSDNFIIVESPQNGRQGQARNIGLSYASGEWIGFIDSDDWIEPDYFEKMLKEAKKDEYEMICCGSIRDKSEEYTLLKEKDRTSVSVYKIYSDDERREFIVHPPLVYSAWGKIIKKNFLIENRLEFPANITYEDAAWGSLVHLYVKKACVISDKLYHYFVNEDSTVLKTNSNHHLDCITAQTYVWKEYNKRGFMDTFKYELQMEHIFSGYLPALKMSIFRYDKPDYNVYLLLRELMTDRLENYKENPYVKKGYLSDYYLMLLSAVDNRLNKAQYYELSEYVKKIGL
ncbi:MAG: glycosyltransferase [Lachnospiraceae bacterium]|nr:glycosyltransferase [Lachnospiraceae bacterium]